MMNVQHHHHYAPKQKVDFLLFKNTMYSKNIIKAIISLKDTMFLFWTFQFIYIYITYFRGAKFYSDYLILMTEQQNLNLIVQTITKKTKHLFKPTIYYLLITNFMPMPPRQCKN